MKDRFHKFASKVSLICGSPYTFGVALLTIITWIFSGPFFGYSDTWQLIINTGTTIITFLMVFLIQNTQNRDARAIHLKLDELIRANKHARNQMIELEALSDEELDKVHKELLAYHKKTEKRIEDVQVHRSKRKK
ncbi:low affinity iron permease family protein [Peredibacter starrii]|uniref:Low affinity iron permease family protein n=1 Tax=Peredibacter starrii TaxID=28202 RepID=A0AAX4HTG6_9BACT|nr:low affinity iron permease family protein [Peredibacter starrii]WPU66688.1 low affinity iron permease family protein [Peredibacter starrii]